MRTEITIGVFDLIIFLGIFQGIFLSWFFIRNSDKEQKANLYNGILLLFLSLTMFEELLNNTGYIVKFLPITNYSEPFNFTFAPLLYFYVVSCLDPKNERTKWPHFVVAVFWAFYMILQFIQPNEIKYNSFIETKHPDWEYMDVKMLIDDDPLSIRHYINQLTLTQFFIYMFFIIRVYKIKSKEMGQSFLKPTNELILILRNTAIHFIIIILIYLGTKLYYGMSSDIGGYLISTYISFMIFATSYQIVIRSNFFDHPQSFFNFPVLKYQKSSLSENDKDSILKKIKHEMDGNKYFTNNLSSLSGLSKQIAESGHHVSQVINEKLNMNFFELLAWYRVEEAKKILVNDKDQKITIEELAEKVGYNSKSSFNTAFKKLTDQTPSEFRKNPIKP